MEPDRQAIGVLLIGDLLLTRAALRQLLAGLGFEILGEGPAVEAASLVRQHQPDVTVVDLDPALDTPACIEDVLSASGGTRVIVLSDRTHVAGHAHLVEAGAAGLVMKHDPPEILDKAIRKVHAGEVWLDRTSTAEALTRLSRRRRLEDAEDAKIEALTRREHEVIALIGEGLKNAEIARRLFISESTVRNHLTSIFEKLDLSDRFELAVYAFRHGLVPVPHPPHARRPASG